MNVEQWKSRRNTPQEEEHKKQEPLQCLTPDRGVLLLSAAIVQYLGIILGGVIKWDGIA